MSFVRVGMEYSSPVEEGEAICSSSSGDCASRSVFSVSKCLVTSEVSVKLESWLYLALGTSSFSSNTVVIASKFAMIGNKTIEERERFVLAFDCEKATLRDAS